VSFGSKSLAVCIDSNVIFFSGREYADEALKHGKVFKDVAKDKLDQMATETMKSKTFTKGHLRAQLNYLLHYIGAKEFASEAMKATSEYANQASEMLQEKVPVALEGQSKNSRADRSHSIFEFCSFSW
jgi:hypothetical protein